MQPFNPHRTEGKEWCRQCERLQAAGAVRACKSQWCQLKALLPADETIGFAEAQPIAAPVDVAPQIIARVERADRPVTQRRYELAEPVERRKPGPKRGPRPNRDANGLTPMTHRLLEAMKKRADKANGEVAVSFNDVFDEIGCTTPSTVSPHMTTLIEKRLVTIIERKGGRAKTRYLIHGFAEKPPIGEPPAHIVGERTVEADELAEPPVVVEPETRVVAGLTVQIFAEECGSCRFSKCVTIGRIICRRMPPDARTGSPTVKQDDWCGEYQKAHKTA